MKGFNIFFKKSYFDGAANRAASFNNYAINLWSLQTHKLILKYDK